MFKNKQWFLDRIGKRVFRDANNCCAKCKEITENGLIIQDKDHALYLYETEKTLFEENNIYLNYRDIK